MGSAPNNSSDVEPVASLFSKGAPEEGQRRELPSGELFF